MAINFGSGVGQVIQTVQGTANLNSQIAAAAANPAPTGLTTRITPKQTGSDFIVTVAGFCHHNNSSAGNRGIKLFVYAQVNGSGGYSNVLNNMAVSSHITVSWVDFPGEFTVYVPNSAVSYSLGQYIDFQPYYQRGSNNSTNTNYFHHTGGSGNGVQCQRIIQEIAS